MAPVLTTEQYEILREYGNWMKGLYEGELSPISKDQEVFIDVVNNAPGPADNIFQLVFWKYLKRLEIANKGNLNNTKVLALDDRSEWKKIRNMRF
jgi:uncharacterized protein YifE (UPF0438 family)